MADSSGIVHVISIPAYPTPPRHSHSFNLKASANLRVSPGAVTSLAWTSDGYGLAVGYENGWAVWSMGGRLGGWGLADEEGGVEGFMEGVSALVSRMRDTLTAVLGAGKPGAVRACQDFSAPPGGAPLLHSVRQERDDRTAFTGEQAS
jgi:hypothetical protein